MVPPLIDSAARKGLVTSLFVIGFFGLSALGGAAGLLAMMSGVAGMVYVVREQILRERESRALSGRGVPGAALASYGIAVSFFAALPVALVVYASLRFIWPDLIGKQMEASVALLSAVPEYSALAVQMQSMLDKGQIPTAADMMASVLTLMVLTGLCLGILGAVFAKLLVRK